MRRFFHNALICTCNPAGDWHADGAILAEDGRIEWIGRAAEAPEAEGAERVDLGGRVVVPGFVNTHAHGGLTLHRGACDDGDLFQWATALAPHTAHMTIQDNIDSTWLAVLEMARSGFTTACDCARFGAGIFSDVASAVGMRSLSGALANSPELRPAGRPNWPLALEETRAAMERHAGNPLARFYLGAHSPYNCTPELLVEVKRHADRLGLPFNIHAAENRAEVDMILARHGKRPVAHLDSLGILDRGTILAHAVWLDDAEMEAVARSGSGVAHNPVSNGKLASGVAAVPALRRRGIPVGLGTDSTLSNNRLDPFQEMKTAILLQRATTLDGFSLGARDALEMATVEGARVLGWEAEIGSLAVGKQADFVAIDVDHPLGRTQVRALSDVVYAATPADIARVVVAGETIVEHGRFTRIDEAAIRAEIRARHSPGDARP